MKSLRDDEVAHLNSQVQKLTEQIQKITEENNRLQRELALMQMLTEAKKEIISFAKEQIEQFKLKLSDRV